MRVKLQLATCLLFGICTFTFGIRVGFSLCANEATDPWNLPGNTFNQRQPVQFFGSVQTFTSHQEKAHESNALAPPKGVAQPVMQLPASDASGAAISPGAGSGAALTPNLDRARLRKRQATLTQKAKVSLSLRRFFTKHSSFLQYSRNGLGNKRGFSSFAVRSAKLRIKVSRSPHPQNRIWRE